MKKKLFNQSYIEGVVYQHDLEIKVSGPNSKNPGTEFISGTVEIATDDAGINIVPVHYTYVVELTKQGKPNNTYSVLKNLINKTYKTVMADGADVATRVRIDSTIALNEFYTDRNGTEELVSVKRNEGGFIHVIGASEKAENERNTFDVDIVITGVRRLEADEEKGLPEKGIVKGAIFGYPAALLPVEFSVIHPGAIDYFESLGATNSNPVFTRVKGNQISETITKTYEEESAFGAPSIRTVKNTRKDFVITWAQKETYEWDDESSITAQEFLNAIAERETYLATMKKRSDEYKASKNQPSAIAAPAAGGFNF